MAKKTSEYELVTHGANVTNNPCEECIFYSNTSKLPNLNQKRKVETSCIIALLDIQQKFIDPFPSKIKQLSCEGTYDVVKLSHKLSGQIEDPETIVQYYKEMNHE